MAIHGIGVHRLAGDPEAVRQNLGGLAHGQSDDGIGQAAQ